MREWLYRKLWRVRRVRTKEQALRSIRDHHRALGIPVDHLTDEELADNIYRLGMAARNACMTVEETSRGLVALGRAMRAAG